MLDWWFIYISSASICACFKPGESNAIILLILGLINGFANIPAAIARFPPLECPPKIYLRLVNKGIDLFRVPRIPLNRYTTVSQYASLIN